MPGFVLDPAFDQVSVDLVALPLCASRVMNDDRFPWIILIPRVADAVELEDLGPAHRAQLLAEIVQAGRAVRAMGKALGRPVEKLNIGLLGNVTRQLHVHVVGRRADDPNWPGPPWGEGRRAPERYGLAALGDLRAAAARALGAVPTRRRPPPGP